MIELFGTGFRIGSGIRLREEGALPRYLIIQKIVVVLGSPLFKGVIRNAEEFDPHLAAFRLAQPEGGTTWRSIEGVETLHSYHVWVPLGGGGEFYSDRSF